MKGHPEGRTRGKVIFFSSLWNFFISSAAVEARAGKGVGDVGDVVNVTVGVTVGSGVGGI